MDAAERDLHRSGLDIVTAKSAGITSIEDASTIYADFHASPALLIAYHDPFNNCPMYFTRGKESLPFVRVRYLASAEGRQSAFAKRKQRRYGQPGKSGTHPYFPCVDGLDWRAIAQDPAQAVIITEGEKKALAGALAGFNVIGLGGVYNFLARGRLLPHLADYFMWEGRDVYLCFDSDAATNPDIQAAEERLASELGPGRGAKVYLTRLAPSLDGAKAGLDDVLVTDGPAGLETALVASRRMNRMDELVLDLNQHVAWIEADGAVHEIATGVFMKSSNFVKGSRYSAFHTYAVGAKGAVTKLSVAQAWLSHPMARRYTRVTFSPGVDDQSVALPDGGTALNMWRGWEPARGDISLFLRLHAFIFSKLPPALRDFALKLVAYKAQNPAEKVPLSIVLVGQEGSGKSMWMECVRMAFAPYDADVDADAIGSSYNGWVERTLIAGFDEVDSEHIISTKSRLRKLISAEKIRLHEKYRTAYDVHSYTLYILTSNHRAVGSYGARDRRMFVVDCPDEKIPDPQFYIQMRAWQHDGGPKRLLGYLLDYDLAGWRPPTEAPLTAEKHMAYMEGLSAVQRLAEEIRAADHHCVLAWLDSAAAWARAMEVSGDMRQQAQARETLTACKSLQVRPFYTPDELTALFPLVALEMASGRGGVAGAAGTFSRQLRDAGVTYLRPASDPRGFKVQGRWQQYLIIAEPGEWREPLSQDGFDFLLKQYPRYRDLRR